MKISRSKAWPGNVFLLGNTSWRIRYVRGGQVIVRDAEGAPATVPFWLGEAPGAHVRTSDELIAASGAGALPKVWTDS